MAQKNVTDRVKIGGCTFTPDGNGMTITVLPSGNYAVIQDWDEARPVEEATHPTGKEKRHVWLETHFTPDGTKVVEIDKSTDWESVEIDMSTLPRGWKMSTTDEIERMRAKQQPFMTMNIPFKESKD